MEELNKLIEEAREYAKDKDFFDEYVVHEDPEVVEIFLQDSISQLREGKASSLEELYPDGIMMLGLEAEREEKADIYLEIGAVDIAKLAKEEEVTSKEMAPVKEKGIKAFIRKMINKIKGIGK